MEVKFQTERWLLRALAVLRAAQVLPSLPVLASSRWDNYYQPSLVVVLYLAYAGWAAALFGVALRRGWTNSRWVIADVVITTACVLAVGLACRPAVGLTWQNWVVGPAMGAAILTLLFLGRRAAVIAGGFLVGAYVASLHADVATGEGVNAILGNVGSGIAFTVAAGLVAKRLRRSASTADLSMAEALVAREAEARMAERVRSYDLLHTNVLATLTVIAGSGGELSTEIRDRCVREIEYLRSMGRSVRDASPTGLNLELAAMIRDQSALGMDIHYSSDGLPHELPANVIEAVTHAAREALNNAMKYAGTKEAWVVGIGDDGLVTVTVTDQGRGFDQLTVQPGFGLANSIRGRMAAVGGQATVRSYPGQGTTVELSWTP